ncbi:S-layer homology domain-containing protein [Phormidium sp. CCY1219]|uniref:S-layer homology domain-containing protein n=1 Tax=Phormidium sp. CCY1219 TaxID=2886104 RepID=UPI002D1E53FA|nr:S-layer homology domain-containing protein [Phormidium sp. CCY1219]MEB3829081.1 S-layer homology domain-containing protein [Phormidium sp. CCY1219]
MIGNKRVFRGMAAIAVAVGALCLPQSVAKRILPVAVAQPSPQPSFPDIQNHWAKECVQQLAAEEIISGYSDGTFRLNNPVTRAEFAAFIANAFPNEKIERDPPIFGDVRRDDWAHQPMTHAYRRGFMSGYENGNFRPGQEIPRVQTFVALASGLNYVPASQPQDLLNRTYADAQRIPSYATEQIAGATEANIVVTPEANEVQFDPQRFATRGEIAAAICQALPDLPSVPPAHVANENQYREAQSGSGSRDEYEVLLTEESMGDSRTFYETPKKAALEEYGFSDAVVGRAQQEVTVDYEGSDKAIVTLTQTNLPDDAVRDMRYRLEMEQSATPEGPLWGIVWVGRQHRCQPRRGPQQWTTRLCS